MPQIGHIELSIIEEDTTYWLTFLRGDLDVVNLLPRFQATALIGDKLAPDLAAKGISIYRAPPPVVSFTAFNFRDPVVGGFSPEKVALRRAIALAYKGDDLVHVVFHDNAERAQMPIPPGVTGYDPFTALTIPTIPSSRTGSSIASDTSAVRTVFAHCPTASRSSSCATHTRAERLATKT